MNQGIHFVSFVIKLYFMLVVSWNKIILPFLRRHFHNFLSPSFFAFSIILCCLPNSSQSLYAILSHLSHFLSSSSLPSFFVTVIRCFLHSLSPSFIFSVICRLRHFLSSSSSSFLYFSFFIRSRHLVCPFSSLSSFVVAVCRRCHWL